MKKRLFATTAICGLAFFVATPAFAACAGGSPTYTCAGTDATDYDLAVDTTFDNGVAAELSGMITNSGALIKTGVGQLTLSGNNSGFSGNIRFNAGAIVATTDNNLGTGSLTFGGGTLLFGAAFNTANTINMGSSHGAIDNGGFNITLSGLAIGNNALFIDGTGMTSMTGANNAWNSSILVNNGTTLAANATGSGAGNLTLQGGGTSTFQYLASFDQSRTISIGNNTNGVFNTNGFDSNLSGIVTGAATSNFVKTGTGLLTLSANNSGTFSGGINITGGTLSVSAANNLGSGGASNNISFDGGTLAFSGGFANGRTITLGAGGGTIEVLNGQTLTQNGLRSGAGALTKTGAGILILNNIAANTGVVNVNGGILSIDASDRLGDESATNDLAFDGGTLRYAASFDQARDVVFNTGGGTINTNGFDTTLSGTISGSGALTKTGGGWLTLSGTNTNSGRIIISGGAIFASSAANLGNQGVNNDIELSNNGSLAITSAFNQTRDVIMTGDGQMSTNNFDVDITGILSGSGIFTKSGSGTITFIGNHTHTGDLGISAGGVEFRETTNRTYNGVISGAGDFTKSGASTLTLSGNSTLVGTTNVSAGTLIINGNNNGSDVSVGASGTLKGTGTTKNLTNNGIVAPGNSIGTLNVAGTVDFANGSTYDVEINDAGQSDLIDATGAITINGGATLKLSNFGGANNYNAGPYTYTILDGASVTGTFGTINNTFAFLDETMIYNATNVQVRMERNAVSFANVVNQQEQDVAAAVEALVGSDLKNAITGLSASQTQDAMEQLSNQHGSNSNSAAAASTAGVINKIGSHLANYKTKNDSAQSAMLSSDPETYVAAYLEPSEGDALYQETAFWAQALGSVGRTSSDSDNPASDRHSYGMMGGVDLAFDDVGFYGLFMGYEQGEVETNSRYSSSDIDNYHLGAYAKRPVGGVNVSGGAALTYHNIDTQRYVVIPGFQSAPQSDTDGYTASAFVEVSKDYEMHDYDVTPFAAVAVSHSHINGYTERNGGTANLVVDDTNFTNPSTTLGARVSKDMHWDDKTIAVGASFGWQHTFGDVDPSTDMRFETGTLGFNSSGAPRARDQALVSVGAAVNVGPGANAFAGYDGVLSADNQDHGFKAGVKVDF